MLARAQTRLAGSVADNEVYRGLTSLQWIARGFSVYAGAYLALFNALLIWGAYSAEVDTVWLVMSAVIQ